MKANGERDGASRAKERAAAEGLLRELQRRGLGEAEVYAKQGKSRTFERAFDRESMQVASEMGWAARAGDARRSLFLAGTGTPSAARAFSAPIDPSPHPLLLPEPWSSEAAAPSTPPGTSDTAFTPLATENEAATLFEAVERRLGTELAGARLLRARLDDGASEAALVSSRGIRTESRARAAWLRLEAEHGGTRVELALAERDSRRMRPDAIARRLADRLAALARNGDAAPGVPGTFVLAAPLAARLVEALSPLFVGRGAATRLAPLLDAQGRLAAPAVSLVDDGRLEGGLLAAATDGEGVPTRRVVLVEKGIFRRPLVAWWEAEREPGEAPPGCARRASYRDLPRRAPTHLFLEPGEAAATALLSGVGDGVFLIDAEGAVELRASTLEWNVRVSGFRLRAGEAPSPLGPCRLGGTVGALLSGVRAAARDLVFVPGDGMYGAPTLLVEPEPGGRGLHLRPVALR